MTPLPLSGHINLPVTVFGCFLVCHNRGRYLFKYQDRGASAAGNYDAGNQLIESWNRELMSCVCDSYVEMVLEIQKLRRDASSSIIDSSTRTAINRSLKASGDQIYSFWPRSSEREVLNDQLGDHNNSLSSSTAVLKADWECLKERVIHPFYSRIVDFPVWQLYSGNLVKAEEGMFLSQPGDGIVGSVLPATVCSFVKEHYPVFSVPWELVTEIQAVGFPVREIRPKMVRDLLKVSSKSITLRSVDMYIDVIEYCLSDFQHTGSSSLPRDNAPVDLASTNVLFPETAVRSTSSQLESNIHSTGITTQGAASSGDALEMVTSLGRALFDFGRGVVDDIGRGAPSAYRNTVTSTGQPTDLRLMSIAAELKGLPCPTATGHLKKLGVTELWVGNKEQQSLMVPLGEKFVHPKVLDRQLLGDIFSNASLQALLKLKNFSLNLLAHHMKLIFHEDWVNHVMGPNVASWLSWEKLPGSGRQGGPSSEWVRIFWKSYKGSQEELSLFYDWPLIPAFIGQPVLCRVRQRHLVFIPPLLEHPTFSTRILETESTESYVDGVLVSRDNSEAEVAEAYTSAFARLKVSYPWLLPMLNQCNIPIFDEAFIDCTSLINFFYTPGSLGQVIASKLVAVKQAGYFTEPTDLSTSNCDALFSLFSDEFFSNNFRYAPEEIEVLRSLPIYKTVVGSYTKLHGQDQCMIPSNSFFKPYDEHCLSYATDSNQSSFVRALGVLELHDQQILVRFGLPGFERKPHNVQEEILVYIFKNWHDLQSDPSVVEALKETKFVRSSDEFSTDLLKPVELFDPGDALLISIFFGERKKFPGERFSTEGWIRILRKLGLRTAKEVDVIIECARRVEFLGVECMKSSNLDDFEADTISSRPEVSPEVWTLGGSVVEFVISHFALFFSNNFCELLGKIACVPAELGFPSVGCKRVLASYSESVLSKDWPLAWSCAPILCRQHIVPPEYSWGALHLRSPPAFSTVLKHLQVKLILNYSICNDFYEFHSNIALT
jgi:sacsin